MILRNILAESAEMPQVVGLIHSPEQLQLVERFSPGRNWM